MTVPSTRETPVSEPGLTVPPRPRTLPASPADLDVLELASLGAPLPGLRLTTPSASPVILEDPERTPVARVEPAEAGGGVRLTLLQPLARRPALAHLPVRPPTPLIAQGAVGAVLFDDLPTRAGLAAIEGLGAGTGGLLFGALVGRAQASEDRAARLLGAVSAVAAAWAARTGRTATPVAVPWSRAAVPGTLTLPGLGDPEGFGAWFGAWSGLDRVLLAPDDGGGRVRAAQREAQAEAVRVHPPEVLAFLRPGALRGTVVLFTGYSGSGKSTVARAVEARLEARGETVTVLDGDEVRSLLSAGLGFDREGRSLNVRRIGWVGSIVARHGGVALAAPIAPFAADRAAVRRMTEAEGGRFLLVHVATPLEVCEARDRKGLYAAARAGRVPEFTGVSSPYETPTDADLVVDTSLESVDDAATRVLDLLEGTDR